MESVFRFILLICWSFGAVAAHADVVARVEGEEITTEELLRHARSLVNLQGHLQMPGGPYRLLEDLVQQKLLLKEGERRGIPRAPEVSEVAYTLAVRKRLMPPCEKPDSSQAQAFFQQNPELFSVPSVIRLSRVGLAVGDDPQASGQQLFEIKTQIEAEELSFAEAVERYSEDIIGKDKGGDIGFIFNDPDQPNPLFDELSTRSEVDIHGPFRQEDMWFIYKVTERREPVLQGFADVEARVVEAYTQHCLQGAFAELMKELKHRWSTEILVDTSWMPTTTAARPQ